MARATKFLIGHAVKQDNKIQIDVTKPCLVRSENYSNGRGGLWNTYDIYISKIADFIEGYYETTVQYPDSTSGYNKIPQPLAIGRFKEQLTQKLYIVRNQKIRHTVGRRTLPETFEYQWYINEKFHVSVLMPDGSIEIDMTNELSNEIYGRIKRNTEIVNHGYEKSRFSERLLIQKRIRDIIMESRE